MLTLARHARQFYPLASSRQRASQSAKWAAAVRYLGNRWILAKPVQKLSEPRPV